MIQVKKATAKASFAIAGAIAIGFVFLFFIYTLVKDERAAVDREMRAIYPIWVKANPEHRNLSFDEWAVLYRGRLLPGSATKKSDD